MAKVMISVPDDLLAAVDSAARTAEQSRSAYVREALRRQLASGGSRRTATALAALRREFRGGDWHAESLIRVERDR